MGGLFLAGQLVTWITSCQRYLRWGIRPPRGANHQACVVLVVFDGQLEQKSRYSRNIQNFLKRDFCTNKKALVDVGSDSPSTMEKMKRV